jgi:hypothetical protein
MSPAVKAPGYGSSPVIAVAGDMILSAAPHPDAKSLRPDGDRSDDSKASEVEWHARDSVLLRTYFQMCAKFDDFFVDHPSLDEGKVRDYFEASGLACRQGDRMILTHAGVLLCCKRDQIPRYKFHVHVKFVNRSDPPNNRD